MKKLPTTYSIDELLTILETDSTELQEKEEEIEFLEESELDQDIVPFLSHYNFQPGDKRVRAQTVYQLYYQWSAAPVSPNKFGLSLSTYFKNDGHYLLLNKSIFEIAKEVQKILSKRKRQWKSKGYLKHFHHFLDRYKIVKGDCYIEVYLLYHLYDRWCYDYKTSVQVGYRTFFRFMRHFFEIKVKASMGERTIFVGVNKEVLGYFTEDQLERLRSDKDLIHERYRQETQKQKKYRQKSKR